MEKNEKINLLLFMILASGIFFAWNYFFDTKPAPQPIATEQTANSTPSMPSSPVAALPQKIASVEEIVKADRRIKIESGTLKGSLSLKGARIDDLVLKNYRETTAPDSEQIQLLAPMGTQNPYYVETGWASNQRDIQLPDATTPWQTDQNELTPEKPLTLHWDNGHGLRFERTISLDQHYVFTITDRVHNSTSEAITLSPYGLIRRFGQPKTAGFYILHEGPIVCVGKNVSEKSYSDLEKHPLESLQSDGGGWIGFTDKYWLTAVIPQQNVKSQMNLRHIQGPQNNTILDQGSFQTDFANAPIAIAASGQAEATIHVFAGAKELDVLDNYEKVLGIQNFDRAVDFGWFYLLTKPIFYALTFFHDWIGNFGLAIMLLTVLLKIAFFPLANKSFRSTARMKHIQPKVEQIRNRYADDKMRMNQEVMELYKKEKVNPLSGCLPMLIQIPVFFALYKVLFISIEMRQAPFFGWIHDLSQPDPTSFFNLFGLIPWDPPSFLMIGVWPLLMGLSMLLQQKMNPPPTDPAQAKIFMLMPVMFTVMLAQFPAGLVIYWTWNNIITILQQMAFMYFDARHHKTQK
ncbi:MAG: membrane protein insertase YidC [Candidatus Nucleicultricaceae bacterium]|jgi:YidC/Oxa1 family membrane protein insertase